MGFPGGSDGKESACSERDLGSNPGLEDSLEKGLATHSSILVWRIPMDRGAWQATVHGVIKSRTQLSRLSTAHVNSQVSIQVWGKLDIKCVYVTYLHLFPTFFIVKAFEQRCPNNSGCTSESISWLPNTIVH